VIRQHTLSRIGELRTLFLNRNRASIRCSFNFKCLEFDDLCFNIHIVDGFTTVLLAYFDFEIILFCWDIKLLY
jgi:hypothetical protein